jgi:hypothetical protein
MTTHGFETVTRHAAAGISRRSSLLTLSGAALAATAGKPGVSAAKKGGESCGKKHKKKCNNNKAACNALAAPICPDPECLATFAVCCNECFTAAFLTCLLAAAE